MHLSVSGSCSWKWWAFKIADIVMSVSDAQRSERCV